MSIVYPLTMPTTPPGPRQIVLAKNFIVGENDSPFTAQAQVYEHPGSWWTAKVDLPAMQRATAAPWLAFLAALNGKSGTFLLGDPLAAGPIGSAGGSPIVNGAGQTGKQLAISGLTGVLKAGDYFQLGSSGENLLTYSNDFTQPSWLKASSIVDATGIVGPDGVTYTTIEINQTVAANGYIWQQLNSQVCANLPFNLSVWLKSGTLGGAVVLRIRDGAGGNEINATVAPTGTWTRFSASGMFPSNAALGVQIYIDPTDDAGTGTWYAWGAQLARGLTLSNYIPTLASSIGSTQRLYLNLTDQGPGSVVLDVFPRLRNDATNPNAAPLAGEPLVLANPTGLFRLDANVDQYTIETAGFYDISFGAREAF